MKQLDHNVTAEIKDELQVLSRSKDSNFIEYEIPEIAQEILASLSD